MTERKRNKEREVKKSTNIWECDTNSSATRSEDNSTNGASIIITIIDCNCYWIQKRSIPKEKIRHPVAMLIKKCSTMRELNLNCIFLFCCLIHHKNVKKTKTNQKKKNQLVLLKTNLIIFLLIIILYIEINQHWKFFLLCKTNNSINMQLNLQSEP